MNKTIKNLILTPFNLLYRISPKLTLQLLFRLKCKAALDLKNPKTYNEKLNWLKLYYRNNLMVLCADKYAVRSFIEQAGLGEHLPRLYWHGDDPEKIPFDDLPNEFVIKSTTGSGNNIIVKDKASLDYSRTKKQIGKWLKEKYLPAYGEWHYMKIVPTIVIEEFISDGVNFVPIDYKFFCFNNRSERKSALGCIAVDLDRYSGHKRLIYDDEWNFLPNVRMGFSNQGDVLAKPAKFDEMREAAETLSSHFPACRVDFYVVKDKFYIGELTFFNGAGFDLVTPLDYNLLMGSWLKLPEQNLTVE